MPDLAANTAMYKSEYSRPRRNRTNRALRTSNPAIQTQRCVAKSWILTCTQRQTLSSVANRHIRSKTKVSRSKNFANSTKPDQSTSPKHLQDLSVGTSVRLRLASSSQKKHFSVPKTSKSIHIDIVVVY